MVIMVMPRVGFERYRYWVLGDTCEYRYWAILFSVLARDTITVAIESAAYSPVSGDSRWSLRPSGVRSTGVCSAEWAEEEGGGTG